MSNNHTERAPNGIKWADLTPMTKRDALRELTLPLPWLVLSLILFATSLWPLGFAASFMFFLCGLRLNHEAIHNNLGLTRKADFLVLHGLSFLMGASNHAVCHGHLIHHKHAMGPEDFEGKCGDMSALQVLAYGPRFPVDVNRAAWAGSTPKARRRILIDWALNGVMLTLGLMFGGVFLLHVIAITIAQCLTAFFAVWVTHHGATEAGIIARSQRGILARAAYLMFYHREHHLFPKVPVHRLPEMARRLDRGVPGYAAERMPVIPVFDKVEKPHA